MDELQANLEWKEAARWLKFEEDVENGGRWSKPHVATLSLHSLLELRKCLLNGACILDFPHEDLTSIVDNLLDYVIRVKLLDESKKELVRNALLLKHVHQHEKEFQRQISNGEKKQFPLIRSIADMNKKTSHANMNDLQGPGHNVGVLATNQSSNTLGPDGLKQCPTSPLFELGGSSVNIKKTDSKAKDLLTQIGSTASVASMSRLDYKMNQNFMKKIPVGAEASNVLVGEVDFLDYQFTAFVRLSKSVVLGDFTEVPVPTRFLFILLGPTGNITKYHEIGRSISTIMSDELFHEVAYKAKTRHDLLNGFDEFLDQVTVLPPGEWDPDIRLAPPNKTLQKEERLERIAESNKTNGSISLSLKKIDEEVHPHDTGPGLEFTGRFCGGLIDDIKRKAPWYLSDYKDALTFQCLSSTLFMYFACLSPIITFGGLLGSATDQNMSAIESLISGLICGVLYALFAGQPMTVLGSTGPVLVFETILNSFSKDNGIDYMGFRAWIGLWTALILFIIVITDCSALVKYITRFTEESFASLIAIIFIKESIFKLIEINKHNKFSSDPLVYINEYGNKSDCLRCARLVHGLNRTVSYEYGNFSNSNQKQCEALGNDYKFVKNCQYNPDVFFFSVVLYIFTFTLAMILRVFRSSRFFPSFIRSKVADFGVVITIASAVSLDMYFAIDTPKLLVPLKFETTIPTRGWFINPIERNKDKLWLAVVAIIPAFLATILIFMDQHITAVIVNRKENKLNKGLGYHLDLLVVSITIAINSLLGIPWFVAATVLSINHVISLKKESEAAAPGEKPKFLGVTENRLTSLLAFIMIGCSVFLANVLRKIPMPVLYGIFLYMGISSLNGIQFMHRLILIFMPEKHQPDLIFLRHVRTLKVHLFTFIQIICMSLLLFIKQNKKISISFPLMVLALVGIRKLMDYVFTQKELSYLDDIMPEIIKRSREDGTKNDDEDNASDLKKPSSTNRILDENINISQELNKTSIWKDLTKNDRKSEPAWLKRRKNNNDSRKSNNNTNPTNSTKSNSNENLPLINNTNNNNQKTVNTVKASNSIPKIVIVNSASIDCKNLTNATNL